MLTRIGINTHPRRLLHVSRVAGGLFGRKAPAGPPPPPLRAPQAAPPTLPPAGAPLTLAPPSGAAAKIAARIPRWLRPYTADFAHAPFSHLTAFVILHELSAIVPLIGLWYVFHQNHAYIPMDLPSWAIEKGMAVIDKALALFDFLDYSMSEKGKFLMEGAYAYAITKALFPLRIIFSVAGMPWFARWFVVPVTLLVRRAPAKPAPAVGDALAEPVAKKVDKPRL
jgi:hypothetical protein